MKKLIVLMMSSFIVDFASEVENNVQYYLSEDFIQKNQFAVIYLC